MARTIFQIESGQFGLAIVDTDAVGYDDDWQAPGGKVLPTVILSDYESESAAWGCQIIGGTLTSTPDTTTTDVPATWCEPAETIPTPGKSTFEFSGSFLQDPNVKDGLNRFLFEHDTEEAYVYASWGGDAPPRMIGRVRLASGSIGGEARTNLTSDFTLPLSRKPDVEFGRSGVGNSAIVLGGGAGGTVFSVRSAVHAEPTTTEETSTTGTTTEPTPETSSTGAKAKASA